MKFTCYLLLVKLHQPLNTSLQINCSEVNFIALKEGNIRFQRSCVMSAATQRNVLTYVLTYLLTYSMVQSTS